MPPKILCVCVFRIFQNNKLVSEPMIGIFGEMKFPKLTETSYEDWCSQMKTLMCAKGIWEVIETGCDRKDTTIAAAEITKRTVNNRYAICMLYEGVDGDWRGVISGAKTAKTAWSKLAEENERRKAQRAESDEEVEESCSSEGSEAEKAETEECWMSRNQGAGTREAKCYIRRPEWHPTPGVA